MSAVASPFQLLEINVISAQDLEPVSKSIKAYAVAWIHPERKLATQIDQLGHTDPTWNEKFVFRVDEEFLNSDSSVIMIEIYTSAWLRDVLIGTVGVLVSNLLPPSARSGNRKPKLRCVALQIRRPSSGRPQGILNMGVTLLDSTMRSMPMYSELSTSAVGYWDLMDPNNKRNHHNEDVKNAPNPNLLTLQRCQSERNDSTINDYTYTGKHENVYVHEGSESEIGVPRKGGVVVNANGSLCSDVGPSPSVVAAAIAKGLYPMPALPRMAGSSMFDEWSENSGAEGIKTKIERWRTELTPAYDRDEHENEHGHEHEMNKFHKTPKRLGKTPRRSTNKRNDRNGLFSCFGTVCGCEISITCGGRNRKKSGKSRPATASELTYNESSLFKGD